MRELLAYQSSWSFYVGIAFAGVFILGVLGVFFRFVYLSCGNQPAYTSPATQITNCHTQGQEVQWQPGEVNTPCMGLPWWQHHSTSPDTNFQHLRWTRTLPLSAVSLSPCERRTRISLPPPGQRPLGDTCPGHTGCGTHLQLYDSGLSCRGGATPGSPGSPFRNPAVSDSIASGSIHGPPPIKMKPINMHALSYKQSIKLDLN